MTQNTPYTYYRKYNTQPLGDITSQQEEAYIYQRALHLLEARLQGTLLLPGDADYDTVAHDVWYGTIEHSPALIVRCAQAADVAEAITFAREFDLEVAVRSGGHSPAGYSSVDNGIVIDLSHMKAISIDPAQSTARLEPGLTWGEVAEAAQAHGLALTSGDTATVGVGGLLLGGGIGWMVRKQGLALDHLRAVELVTANGQIVRASADENADLFWGLRGGGGNFGIATAFEVNLHPAGLVTGGAVVYDATDGAQTEDILKAYTAYASSAPDELSTITMLMAAPPAPFIPPAMQGKPVVVIMVCYTGDLAEGERVVAPLRSLATPVADIISPMPYPVVFMLTQAAGVRGLQQYVRTMFVQTMNEDVLHTVAAAVPNISHETMVQIRILGGAMGRVSNEATAFAHRDKQAMISVFNSDPHEDTEAALHKAHAEHIWETLRSFGTGAYMNFLENEGEQSIREAYPDATYARLVALKNRYDPTNLFHLNQNIHPTV